VDIITFPDLKNVHVAIAPIANHEADIFPEEMASQSGTTFKRLTEFSSGRNLVHALQEEAGLSRRPILRNSDRSPVWPNGCKGSISHSAQLAAATLTRNPAITGIGIDIEALTELNERLRARLFTPTEMRRFSRLEPALEHPDVLTFSAKEAVYKAIYPIAGLMIEFKEVEISIDQDHKQFSATYLPDTDATTSRNLILNSGHGYFRMLRGHVLTLFVIPGLEPPIN